MSDRSPTYAIGLIAAYNIVQNRMIGDESYVRANIVATAGLLGLGRGHGCNWEELGLGGKHLRNGLLLGLAGAAVTSGVTVAASANPAVAGYFLDQRAIGHTGRQVRHRALIRFPLGTALFEEVAFRGVLYALLRRSGSSKATAAIQTALAFGLWHVIPAAEALKGNPLETKLSTRGSVAAIVAAGVASTAVASLGLSWMRERSNSLVAPWMTHAALNTATFLCGVAAWRRHKVEGETRGGSTDG